MGVRDRLRRFFRDIGSDYIEAESDTVRETLVEIQKHRVAKTVLADKLDRTGFLPGDAALGRIDRRYLPGSDEFRKGSE